MQVGKSCLDGDTQGALDGAGRLGEDGQVGGAATAPDGAAAAVEQRQLHVVPVCHRHQLLLRAPVQCSLRLYAVALLFKTAPFLHEILHREQRNLIH